MLDTELHTRLLGLERPRGERQRLLRIGDMEIGIEGLDDELAEALDSRWGGFVHRQGGERPDYTLRLIQDSTAAWLTAERQAELYRLEAVNDTAHRVIVSYHFAMCAEDDPRIWKLAMADQDREPPGRVVENGVRYLMARLAIERGGFAMHGAGVLREGLAYLFAGPSRSGKTTAVSLAAPAVSMGDDFALVVPGDGGWRAPAVPFDNSEMADRRPPSGLHEVAGIWRLHQADEMRIERPIAGLAVASLMGCTAFSWTLPELSGALLEQVKAFVLEGRFAHLHFSREGDLWKLLLAEGDRDG
jgi:hypothetical protein